MKPFRASTAPNSLCCYLTTTSLKNHVRDLEKRYPGVPSIGCVGMSYQAGVVENGVGVIAFSDGVSAAANVLESVSTMPVKHIRRLEQDMRQVGGGSRDMVCIDFCSGNDACIISIKEVNGSALACYRQVNDSDVLILLQLGDYQAITRQTIQQICQDFPRRSAIFSVNCLFRYKLFSQLGYMQTYLKEMAALGSHAGFVGYGEHYNNRFVNQSMTCVVFE